MSPVRTRLLGGVTIAAALLTMGGGMNTAHAGAYAFADNQITGFRIITTGSVTVLSAARNTLTTAQYSGFPASAFSDPQSGDPLPASNAQQATAGPGPVFPGADVYTDYAGQALGMVGSRGDALTTGNPLKAGAAASNVAESRIVGNTSANGGASGRNTADISFTIAVGAGSTLQFSFNDDISLRTTTDAAAGNTANASISNTFFVNDPTGLRIFDFTPLVGVGVGGGCNPQAAAGSTAGSLQIDIDCSASFSSTAFSFPSTGGTFVVGLRSTSQVDIVSAAIPEPASLGLVGAGMIGLGLLRRRRG